MQTDKIIPLTMLPLDGLGLSVDLKKNKLFQHGEPLVGKRGQYEVADATGKTAKIKILLSMVSSGFTPKVIVNGIKHNLLPSFKVYQLLWISLPYIALFYFNVFVVPLATKSFLALFSFLLISSLASMLNAKIFRSGLGAVARYLLTGLSTLGSILLYFAIIGLIAIATGKIDYNKIKTDADKRTTSIMLNLIAKKFNQNTSENSIEKVTVENGTSLVFAFKAKPSQDDVSSEKFANIVMDGLKSKLCDSENTKIYRDYKATIIFRVEDLNGNKLRDFSLDTTTCRPLSAP